MPGVCPTALFGRASGEKAAEAEGALRGRKSIMDVWHLDVRGPMIGKLLEILTSKIVRIDGSSMEPALPDRAWVIVSRWAYSGSLKPARFDIVRFEDPESPGRWLVKRIVGLPGEEVVLAKGALQIDGEKIEDRFAAATGEDQLDHSWWPRDGEYVVLGDNRSGSRDSRKFGTVQAKAITGKVVRRLH